MIRVLCSIKRIHFCAQRKHLQAIEVQMRKEISKMNQDYTIIHGLGKSLVESFIKTEKGSED
jgi:hypothetical protein